MTKNVYFHHKSEQTNFSTERKDRIEGQYEPFVYILKEITTNKMYIGSRTKQGCLESDIGERYFTSSAYIDWDGGEQFIVSEVIGCASNHDALLLESKLIKERNAVWDESYYNRHEPSIGFNMSGAIFSEETKAKMSKSAKGRPKSEETRRKFSQSKSGKNHPMYGKHHTKEHKDLMSKLITGKKRSESTKSKMSEAAKNRKSKPCIHCGVEYKVHVYKRHVNSCKMNEGV